jgi:hypothetical protein
MLANEVINRLLYSFTPRKLLGEIENPPDWVLAGLNCTDDSEIIATCIHTFLIDWRPE